MEVIIKLDQYVFTPFIKGQPQHCVTHKSTDKADRSLIVEDIQKALDEIRSADCPYTKIKHRKPWRES